MASWLEQIVSFGAAGRVETAREMLLEHERAYEAAFEHVEARRSAVARKLEALVEAKRRAFSSLKRIEQLMVGLTARDRALVSEKAPELPGPLDLSAVDATLSAGTLALSATKGTSAALSTAAGAWALVGAAGTASTGTAISSLSGAAAFNATLAWFGGGAVAAGGAGMLGGAIVLGGIVLAPASVLTAILAHMSANSKIVEIEAAAKRFVEEEEKLQKVLVTIDVVEARAQEVRSSLAIAHEAFDTELERASSVLHRSLWKRVVVWIRSWFGQPRYSEGELRTIAHLGSCATSFARIIDQPLFAE